MMKIKRHIHGQKKNTQFEDENQYYTRSRAASHRWYADLRWGDFVLYILIAGAAFGLLAGLSGVNRQAAALAVLTKDGEPVAQISLEEMERGGELELSAYGYHYRLVYQDGRIRFAEADCPDQICVHTGWISRSSELAACVPGRLVLRIRTEKNQPTGPDDLDVIIR